MVFSFLLYLAEGVFLVTRSVCGEQRGYYISLTESIIVHPCQCWVLYDGNELMAGVMVAWSLFLFGLILRLSSSLVLVCWMNPANEIWFHSFFELFVVDVIQYEYCN